VIPRGGYRLQDMVDDMPGASLAARHPSADGWMAAIVHRRRDAAEEIMLELAERANPSAEGWMSPDRGERPGAGVREPAAVYRIERRVG
jgi:hypothetical protein